MTPDLIDRAALRAEVEKAGGTNVWPANTLRHEYQAIERRDILDLIVAAHRPND